MKSRDERVTTKDAAPNSNTVAALALRCQASIRSSEMTWHVQEFLVDSMGSGYAAVVQLALQMVSSLRATIEPEAQVEPSGVDPKSLDDEDSDVDSRDYQAGQ